MNEELGLLDGISFDSEELQDEINRAKEDAAKIYISIFQKHAEKSAKDIIRRVANAMLTMIGDTPEVTPKAKQSEAKKPEEKYPHIEHLNANTYHTPIAGYHTLLNNLTNKHTPEEREAIRNRRSAGMRKVWERRRAEEDKRAAVYEKINSLQHRKIRFTDLDDEERQFFSPIRESRRIAETFKLRECKCISEANHLLAQYLRDISKKNGYAIVHRNSNGAFYDIRAIDTLCDGYSKKTLEASILSSLSYFFE